MSMKFVAIMLGVFLMPLGFFACDMACGNIAQRQQAAEDADREAAFKAMSPAKHLELAGRMGLGPKAEKHLAAVPEGYPGKAELVAKIAEGRKVREAARVKAEAEAAEKREWERANAHRFPGRPLTQQDYDIAEGTMILVLKKAAKNSDSVRDIQSHRGEQSKVGKIVCWRVPVTFRAANSFNAIVPGSGSVWLKDGEIVKYQVD